MFHDGQSANKCLNSLSIEKYSKDAEFNNGGG
jgi:hypothetical protein